MTTYYQVHLSFYNLPFCGIASHPRLHSVAGPPTLHIVHSPCATIRHIGNEKIMIKNAIIKFNIQLFLLMHGLTIESLLSNKCLHL